MEYMRNVPRFSSKKVVPKTETESCYERMMESNQDLFRMMLQQQNSIMMRSMPLQVSKVEETYTEEEFQRPMGGMSRGKRKIDTVSVPQIKKCFKTAEELGLKL